jgi:hypothetical protein
MQKEHQMSKAAIPFAALIVALFVSSVPGFAKGGSNSAGKDFSKASVHSSGPTSAKTRKEFSGHGSKSASSNANGAGAGKSAGYTGSSPGAGASKT